MENLTKEALTNNSIEVLATLFNDGELSSLVYGRHHSQVKPVLDERLSGSSDDYARYIKARLSGKDDLKSAGRYNPEWSDDLKAKWFETMDEYIAEARNLAKSKAVELGKPEPKNFLILEDPFMMDGFDYDELCQSMRNICDAFLNTGTDVSGGGSDVAPIFRKKILSRFSSTETVRALGYASCFDNVRTVVSSESGWMTAVNGSDNCIINIQGALDMNSGMYLIKRPRSVYHEVGHVFYRQSMNNELKKAVIASGFTSPSTSIDEAAAILNEIVVYGGGRIKRTNSPQVRVGSAYPHFVTHVAMRCEIERKLFSGEACFSDIEKVWEEHMVSYFGYPPSNESEQWYAEPHWQWGKLGYFQTYNIGLLIAVNAFMEMIHDDTYFAAISMEAGRRNWMPEASVRAAGISKDYVLEKIKTMVSGIGLETREYRTFVLRDPASALKKLENFLKLFYILED